jgi:hypothetical protein
MPFRSSIPLLCWVSRQRPTARAAPVPLPPLASQRAAEVVVVAAAAARLAAAMILQRPWAASRRSGQNNRTLRRQQQAVAAVTRSHRSIRPLASPQKPIAAPPPTCSHISSFPSLPRLRDFRLFAVATQQQQPCRSGCWHCRLDFQHADAAAAAACDAELGLLLFCRSWALAAWQCWHLLEGADGPGGRLEWMIECPPAAAPGRTG